MFKKTKKIVFRTHPHMNGYAKLMDNKHLETVRLYGGMNSVNSREFEKLQETMKKANYTLEWHA